MYNQNKYRMVEIFIWVFFLSILLCIKTSFSQTRIDTLREVWKTGNYQQALPLLLKYRESPYGRNAEVDYMIATSACRISDYQELSLKCFNWILSNYSLDSKTRQLITEEKQLCTPDNMPSGISFVNERITARAGVRGKMFYWLDEENALTSVPVEVIRVVPYNEFRKRLFKTTDSEKSILYLKNLIGEPLSADASEHFVLISLAGHNKASLKTIGSDMEKVFNFFLNSYRMPHPDFLITIFLTRDPEQMQRLAEKLHGIRVSENGIGYSFQDDLSIIGIIQQNYTYVGTLAHELFHLMAHNHFGDIPPWMDEGIAALYEVMKIKADSVYGINNWRGKILKEFWSGRPSIEKLVKMNWEEFEAAERNYESIEQTTNHATARYFILYLQEKGKLTDVYNIFRKRKIEDIKLDPGSDSIYLLETLLGKNVAEVDEEFASWFKTLPN